MSTSNETKTNKQVRVFISQPMKDKTDEEILAQRKKVEATLTELGFKDYYILDSFFQGVDHETNPLYLMGESLKQLSKADVVYFTDGWNKYRGCKFEYEAWLRFLAERGVLCYTEYRDSSDKLYVISKHQIYK